MSFLDNYDNSTKQPSFLNRFRGGLNNPMVQLGLALAGGSTPQAGLANAANALMYRQALAQRQRQAEIAQSRADRDYQFRVDQAAQSQANLDRQFAFRQDQAAAAGRGFEYHQDQDGNWFRIEKSTGRAEAVPIEGLSGPQSPYSYGGKMTEAQSKDAL